MDISGSWTASSRASWKRKSQAPASPPKIVATGGLANLIADDSKFITRVDHLLTLDGLRIIYQRNMGTKKRAAGSRNEKAALREEATS